MATAMDLCGLILPSPALSMRALNSQPMWRRHSLNFAASVGSVVGSCTAPKRSCGRRVLSICCEGGNVDVLRRSETESQELKGVANELTCVMKFGGSSLASAERMREVAELILSFPEERPVIVLSAMGKTTNNLLMVLLLCHFYCPLLGYGYILYILPQSIKKICWLVS